MSPDPTRYEFPLEHGERQLWAGVPEQGPVLQRADIFMVPFSLLWSGIALSAFFNAKGGTNPIMFLFLFVALYMTIGRFAADAWRRSRIYYAVTSERIIIKSGNTTTSLALRTLTDVTLSEGRGGSGTITFGPVLWQRSMYAGTPWPGVPQVPAFEFIADAGQVYQLIRQAQQGILPPEERRLR